MPENSIDSPIFTPVTFGPMTLQNRMRLMQRVITRVMEAAGKDMAVLVKMNMWDGFRGGLTSRSLMEEVLAEGFQGLQMARALIRDTDFVNKLRTGEVERSGCCHSNYCIGRMYSLEMKCNRCVADMPERLRREVKNAEKRWSH